MKKILLLMCAVALWSCGKNEIPVTEEPEQEQGIDLSKVHVEIQLSCIGEEKSSPWSDGTIPVKHTILCAGSIGGFIGPAEISLEGVYLEKTGENSYMGYDIIHENEIMVVGDRTTFSYTFESRWITHEATGTPITFDVKIRADNEIVFDSDLVMIL